jgi:hypothetical protein
VFKSGLRYYSANISHSTLLHITYDSNKKQDFGDLRELGFYFIFYEAANPSLPLTFSYMLSKKHRFALNDRNNKQTEFISTLLFFSSIKWANNM